jgi:hypothetical protein
MRHVGVEMALEITKEITLRVKHGTIYIYMCVCLCAEAQTEIQRLSPYCILIYMHLYQYLFICSRARK